MLLQLVECALQLLSPFKQLRVFLSGNGFPLLRDVLLGELLLPAIPKLLVAVTLSVTFSLKKSLQASASYCESY